MKTLAFFLLISTLTSFGLFSQIVSFEKGQIITKSNDTINALVELTPTYDGVVSYQINSNSSIQRIRIKNIKSLATPYNKFQNVVLHKSEYLFRVLVSGNTTLLQYSRINVGTRQNGYGGTFTFYKPPTVIYALRTIEKDYIVYKEKDINLILPLLENCPPAKEMVDRKTFRLEDLEAVVNSLNNCK